MAAMPTPTPGHEEDAMLVTQCLDFCQTLAGKSLTFSFSLTIGTSFSFSVDTSGKGAVAPKRKKKKLTPSAQRRNARRREEFLKRKVNASTDVKSSSESEPVSDKEAEAPPKVLHHHPSPPPSSERRQVISVGREKARPTFSQLDGDPPSTPDTASGLPSSLPPPSDPALPSAHYDELLSLGKPSMASLIAYLKTQASKPPGETVFLKSSSCDKSKAS